MAEFVRLQRPLRSPQAAVRIPTSPAPLQRCGERPCELRGTHPQRSLRLSRVEAIPGNAASEPVVEEVLGSSGQALGCIDRARMEAALGHDFSRVRVHADALAATAAAALHARAFTVGQHVVFGQGHWQLATNSGQRLLTHELIHVVQQAASERSAGHLEVSRPDDPSEREASTVSESLFRRGGPPSDLAMAESQSRPLSVAGRPTGQAIQRQLETPFSGRVRSPVAEELITQETEVMSGLQGMPLTPLEIELARTVFGDSIDYSRVRLMHASESLWFRTVGNVIRIPPFFTVDPSASARYHPLAVDYMRHTFIHEMTHVWQYQHGGTSYISYSLGPQLVAMVRRKGRNAAYCYEADSATSFWEFTPEQQGLIVENFFLMRESAKAVLCGPDGQLGWVTDPAVIGPLVPIHQHHIAQMRAALPAREADIRLQRAAEAPATTAGDLTGGSPDRRLTPIKPVLEIRF
jgi:hypothetical protein